jgi:hypothetical protein
MEPETLPVFRIDNVAEYLYSGTLCTYNGADRGQAASAGL